MIRNISLVGAGNVGRTLGRLFRANGVAVSGVSSRSAESAERAAAELGSRAFDRIADLPESDVILITTPDDMIADTAARIARTGNLSGDTILMHCSGATASSVLRQAGSAYRVASVHPIKSFTDPERDAASFAGTYCGAEGDAEALDLLLPLFTRIGGICFRIHEEHKLLYHTASVFASSYLFAIVKVAYDLYEVAGVDRESAARILDPIMHATISNALDRGPEATVTGPISRGDVSVVEKQIAALDESFPARAALYRLLGLESVELARAKGVASEESIRSLRRLLAP